MCDAETGHVLAAALVSAALLALGAALIARAFALLALALAAIVPNALLVAAVDRARETIPVRGPFYDVMDTTTSMNLMDAIGLGFYLLEQNALCTYVKFLTLSQSKD